MLIPSEESYYIKEVKVFVCRQGKGIVDERHLKTEEDYRYYQIDSEEIRYVIRGQYGVHGLPHRIYESGLQDECYFASGVCNKTRRYKRKLDTTYFKFYDDAEEVLHNIIAYIKWLKTVPNLNLKKNQIKKILAQNEHYIRGVPDFPERKTYQIGSLVKRRSDLKGLSLHLQNELDLL